MRRYFYSDTIQNFLVKRESEVLGQLVEENPYTLETTQRDAWLEEIRILQSALQSYACGGQIYFEYSIPRLGKRVDVVILIGPVVFVLEFKVGEKLFSAHAIDQVWDYALDFKNFHETTHEASVAPILIATAASSPKKKLSFSESKDGVLSPILSNSELLPEVITSVLDKVAGHSIDPLIWERGRYCPTPTIIEAATALYKGHTVSEISRSDAGAINLTTTSKTIEDIIQNAKTLSQKVICFVTGVPGSGKTLVGLNIATKHIDKDEGLHSVFLSGNGPLVAILREALARDKVSHEQRQGRKIRKQEVRSEVKMFIQNVHHFRDDCLDKDQSPPIEHVAIFDEAQRAWSHEQTVKFMRFKKGVVDFDQSEPEFLISCMDRHSDWAVVICLVGGGQEINTGESGIREWISSVIRSFPYWRMCISSQLKDREYAAYETIEAAKTQAQIEFHDELHLSVSMRSFRAENLASFVKSLLDLEVERARVAYQELSSKYPVILTRDLSLAKQWLKKQARGSERYGIVVSSQASRLKPHAIDIRADVDPIHWFLDGKEDVRSSYYLEDVVTEFQVQGLELDWTCVTWDADFRRSELGWDHWSFSGQKWKRICKSERQLYQLNAYRVLLTRARQGMIIVVPHGDESDPTRKPEYYDHTFEYLRELGLNII